MSGAIYCTVPACGLGATGPRFESWAVAFSLFFKALKNKLLKILCLNQDCASSRFQPTFCSLKAIEPSAFHISLLY